MPTGARDSDLIAWLPRVELLAATGFVGNLAALALREARYAGTFPRPLELVYVVSLLVFVTGVGAAHLMRAWLRRQSTVVVSDERSDAVTRRAALVALSAVLLVQVPFIMGLAVSAKALALITVTAAVAVFHAAHAWFDRGA